MTCRLIAGFEDFPTSGNSEARWGASGYYWLSNADAVAYMTVETGRFSYGQALHFSNFGFSQPNTGMVRLTGVDVNQGFFGFAYKWEPSTSGSTYVALWDAINSTPMFTVQFAAMGIVYVWRGYPGTNFLGRSDAGAFQQSQWFFCEIGSLISSTSGTIQVRVNTVPVIDLVAVNNNGGGRGTFNAVMFGGQQSGFNTGYEFHIDDMYFCDAAGSLNNSYLGNVRVKSQFAASAGDSTQFSIGGSSPAPTNWQSVLNTALNDNQFVYDSTVGDEDLYHVQAIINSSSLVHAVQVSGGYRMDDSTQRVARNVLKSGGSTTTGADHYINQNYTMYRDIFELDPSTGVSFTGAGANGMQVGVKVQA